VEAFAFPLETEFDARPGLSNRLYVCHLHSIVCECEALVVKRLRIEFFDDSGCRHVLTLDGPLTRDKIARILDYAELMGGLASPSSLHASPQYGRTKLDRVRDLVLHRLRETTFSSDEVRDLYQKFYGEPIPLTTVATYLSRLVDRGLLRRSGSQGRWRYSLAEATPRAQVE
jgi:hypothetical protein